MKLKGECERDFENWYLRTIRDDPDKLLGATNASWFYLLTDSMQFGVIQDFAEQTDFAFVSQFWELYKDDDYTLKSAQELTIDKFIGWYNSEVQISAII